MSNRSDIEPGTCPIAAREAHERLMADDEPTVRPAWHALVDPAEHYFALCNRDDDRLRALEAEARAKLRAALRVVR